MKRLILLSLSLLLLVATSTDASSANYRRESNSKTSSKNVAPSKGAVVVVKDSKQKTISKLPSKKYTMVQHKGVSYYKSNNKYYKIIGGKYVLTTPPKGFRVSVLPALYTTFMFNNIKHFCAEGIVYKSVGANSYEVVEPQMDMLVPELPEFNVRQVNIDGTIYFEFEGTLYKQVPTASGVQYQVSGSLNN